MSQPELIEHVRYEVVNVADLPIPEELEEPACMVGPWVWVRRRLRRLAPWLVPAQDPRHCCWHHSIDWRHTALTTVRLVREAQAAGIQGRDIGEYVIDAVRDNDDDDDGWMAFVLLVGADCGIELNEDPGDRWLYQDGQHRVAAQLDQGVPQTIIQRFELLDPDTGQPIND